MGNSSYWFVYLVSWIPYVCMCCVRVCVFCLCTISTCISMYVFACACVRVCVCARVRVRYIPWIRWMCHLSCLSPFCSWHFSLLHIQSHQILKLNIFWGCFQWQYKIIVHFFLCFHQYSLNILQFQF